MRSGWCSQNVSDNFACRFTVRDLSQHRPLIDTFPEHTAVIFRLRTLAAPCDFTFHDGFLNLTDLVKTGHDLATCGKNSFGIDRTPEKYITVRCQELLQVVGRRW